MAEDLRGHDARQPENEKKRQRSKRCKHELHPLLAAQPERTCFVPFWDVPGCWDERMFSFCSVPSRAFCDAHLALETGAAFR
jgi:hypothetical protein